MTKKSIIFTNMKQLYVDMDGVIVDFINGYYELTGIDISGKYMDDESFWNPIRKNEYDFWINLKWMPDGKKLWNYIKKYNPQILSSPSDKIESRIGKFDWVKKELPETNLILRSKEYKKDFASPNTILIDDLENNINDWINSGGIGILHISAKDTIQKLRKIGM